MGNEQVDNTQQHTDDIYRIFVPIEDDALMKSLEVDENGDYIVQGVMTSDAMDEEDDSISPDGMDCSYFLEKGWIKYEHGNKPEQFIGEPLEVRVGQFEHPTTMKSVNGIFVKGRLFQQRELAQQAVRTITDLQKSQTKRRMGWSIEGNVKERNRKTGKIQKSVLRNVVLTMNPINTTTWAELAKSFERDHSLTIDMDEQGLDKALSLEGTQEIRRQSIERTKQKYQKEDPQQKWINSFRKYVSKLLVKKSFGTSSMASEQSAQSSAYAFALNEGLDGDEANDFALYIADKYGILKSLSEKVGGAQMGKDVKNALASMLDADLEELEKSLSIEDASEEEDFEEYEEEEEELTKSVDGDEEGDDEGDDEEGDDEGDEDEGDEDDDEGEETQKSFGMTDFSKSFAQQEDNAQAIEVSSFLSNLVDEIGYHMDGFEKSMGAQRKQSMTIVKALSSMGEMMKDVASELAEVKAHNIELQKSLDTVMSQPVGRRSVVSPREVQTLTKSMGQGNNQPLTRGQIGDALMKSFEMGEVNGSEITRFEAGVPVDRLNLPASVKERLGLI